MGFADAARHMKLNRKSLYRALSPRGNPRLDTLERVVHLLGFRFSLVPLRSLDVDDPTALHMLKKYVWWENATRGAPRRSALHCADDDDGVGDRCTVAVVTILDDGLASGLAGSTGRYLRRPILALLAQAFGHQSHPTTPNERRTSVSLEPKLEILSAAQRILWLELATVPDTFVLYGGTGLAVTTGSPCVCRLRLLFLGAFQTCGVVSDHRFPSRWRSVTDSREHAHRVHRPWGPR